MDKLRRKQSQSSMELVQITDNTKSRPGRRALFELLLTAAMSAGCWYTYFSMFPNPVNPAASAVMIMGLPVLLYLCCANRFISRYLVFYVFLGTAVFFLIAYESVWNGFLVMANIVIEVLNNEINAGWIPFQLTGNSAQWARDSMMAMIPVMLLLATGIAHSVYNKEPVLGFILTAAPVVTGLCLKGEPELILLVLLLVCWTSLLALSAAARPVNRRKNRTLNIQNTGDSSLPYLFLIITVVLMLGYIVIFSVNDYKAASAVDDVKNEVITIEEHLRYDKLNGASIDQLSHGDLNDVHPLQYTDNVVLNLHMQLPQPMYLRGFTGGSFSDGKWTENYEGAYSGEYTGITEWLSQQGFYPWMQQERLYRMSSNYDYVSVDVENINENSKYMYMPYEAAMTGEINPDNVNFQKDYAAYAQGLRGQREYTFTSFFARLQDYSETGIAAWLSEVKKSEDWEDYASTEAVYRRYVYDTYLFVSEDDYAVLKSVGAEKCFGKTIEYTLNHIRRIFQEEYVYDINCDSAPDGKYELDYFVNSSKTGNDMHFATTAALLFRSAGIPARYVEGYYLSPKQMELYTTISDVKYDVLDSDAHCWVEIYIDEIGWFPVEVIPGYYEIAKTETEQIQDEEAIKEKIKKNFEDEVPEFDEPDKSDEEERNINPLWFVLLALTVLAIIYEYAGKRRIKSLMASFGTVMTDDKVYEMYRYTLKIMAYDKHRITADPYDVIDATSEKYDLHTGISFEEFIRLVNRVRFGRVSLSEDEHKKMASYVFDIGNHVYLKQNKVKKFVMKFILFYVL